MDYDPNFGILILDEANPGVLASTNAPETLYLEETAIARFENELVRRIAEGLLQARVDPVLQAARIGGAIAKKYGFVDMADDFAQDAAVAALEGRRVAKWAVVDSIRKWHGDTRNEVHKKRAMLALEDSDAELPAQFQAMTTLGLDPEEKLIVEAMMTGMRAKDVALMFEITEESVDRFVDRFKQEF